MSHECTYCDFSAPTRARYMRHLGTQKHARKYLEETKHLIKGVTKNEVIEEENVQEEEMITKEVIFVDEKEEELILNPPNDNIQEEKEEKNKEEDVFDETIFLDPMLIGLVKRLSETIEFSPLFIWMMGIISKLGIFPQNKSNIKLDPLMIPEDSD